MADRHLPGDSVTDPQVAIKYLKDGNERYLKGALRDKSTYKADRDVVIKGQKPFAAVLTCSDSRTPPEIFFDQGIGDIFVCRNAGNFADDTACGSIDFSVGVLGVQVVVVIGHNECGAVINAHKGTSGLPEELQCVLGKIQANFKGGDVNDAVKENVMSSVERIKGLKFVKEKGIPVLGAYYDIGTGVVTWY
ncbi:MAG: carbonic anhydrase [Spirochaetes bacterium]|nr:carbonic anhydrase [Spirochaetota bacterium]